MNRLVVSIGILSVMAAGCAASVAAAVSVSDRITDGINRAEEAFRRGDTAACVEAAEEVVRIWDNVTYYSILISDLGHAVEITSSAAEILSFAQAGNEELYASCDRLQAQIELFRENQIPTLWKIL